MPNQYSRVRRQWKDTDIERDLTALWQRERFENSDAVEGALRIYELAVRVEGWDTVKGWARDALAQGRILNAQLVELAMRALEQRDPDFLYEMTRYLLDNSAPSYFRFWHTLFTTRHAHQGERIFRAQLAELSDYHVIKYRRWLRRILRVLRFRCDSPREQAIGAIAFAMYDRYDAGAYPSPVFRAYLACHDAARTPKKSDKGKPVSRTRQMVDVARAAAELGIWTIAEGIRTSAGLPRTLGYMAAMAPKMTDNELIRALRAFDGNLATADHKRAAEDVVALARYLEERLGKMDVAVEDWCKIYPYQKSPVLHRVFEELMSRGLERELARLPPLAGASLLPIAPVPLEGRAFRTALVLAYLAYRNHADAALYLADADVVKTLAHPGPLWPYGYAAEPPAFRWQAGPDHPHRAFFELIRATFPLAATRRQSTALGVGPYITALRHTLHRRAVLDGAASAADVPVLFFTAPPERDERAALLAHLAMFSAAVLVLFDQRWETPLDAPGVLHVELGTRVGDAVDGLLALSEKLTTLREEFAARQGEVDRAIRPFRLGAPAGVTALSQGPYHMHERPDLAPTAPAVVASKVTLYLVSAGSSKINVIKALREITSLGLAAAKALVDTAPKPVMSDLTPIEAEMLAQKLRAAGAQVAVQ